MRERQQLAEALDAGEPAADEGHGEQPGAARGPGGGRAARSKAVRSWSRIATASSTCFRPIACSGRPGIGERAGHRAGRDDDDRRTRSPCGPSPSGSVTSTDRCAWSIAGHPCRRRSGSGAGAAAATPRRAGPRPSRPRPRAGTAGRSCTDAGRRRHLRLAPPEPPLQLPRRVEPGVAAAHDQYVLHEILSTALPTMTPWPPQM